MPSATLTEYGVRLLTGLRLIDLFEKESNDGPNDETVPVD